jgi:hypothetical protein
MTERDLGVGLRALLGVVGTAALGAGILVAGTQLRGAYLGAPRLPTIGVTVMCGVIALGGAALLRGALRGRIAVRRTRRGRK